MVMDILAWSVSTPLTAEEQADLKRVVARIVEELLGGTGEDDALALYIATLLLNKRSLQHVRNELAVLDFSAAECDSFVAVLHSALVPPEAAPLREVAPPDSAVAEQVFEAVMEANPLESPAPSASDSSVPADSQAAAPTADSSGGDVRERPSLPSTGIEASARPPILTKRKRGDDAGSTPSPLTAQPAAPPHAPFDSAAGPPPASLFASSRGRGRGRGSWRGRGGASLGAVPPSRPPTSSVVLPRASLRYVSPTAKPLDVQPSSLGPMEGSGRGMTGNSRGGGRGRGGFAAAAAAAGAPAPPPVTALSWVNKKSIACKWGTACQHILCDYGHPEREGGAASGGRGAPVRPSLKFGAAVATTAV